MHICQKRTYLTQQKTSFSKIRLQSVSQCKIDMVVRVDG